MGKFILITFAGACFLLSTSVFVFSKTKSGDNPNRTQKERSVSGEKVKSIEGSKKQNPRLRQKAVLRKGRKDSRRARNGRAATAVFEAGEDDGEFIEYTAQKGDTVEKIAMKFDVEKDDILESNSNLTQRLSPGRVLLIPKTGESATGDDIVDFPTRALKSWKSREERYMLVKVARSFMGTPYRYGGENVRGLDSSAFVQKVYDIFDVPLPRFARDQYKTGPRISREELSVGDLVFFKTKRNAKYPTHVGIYIGDGNFIHSFPGSAGNGVKIDSLQTDFYDKAYMGATRVKKSADEVSSDAPLNHSS
ncbi:MAG TPA: peptidoglycan endopeptidase [Syntrophorhabdaceae bacterium]|jgi:LysM repeat protein